MWIQCLDENSLEKLCKTRVCMYVRHLSWSIRQLVLVVVIVPFFRTEEDHRAQTVSDARVTSTLIRILFGAKGSRKQQQWGCSLTLEKKGFREVGCNCCLQVPEEHEREDNIRLPMAVHSERTRVNSHKLQKGKFQWKIKGRRKFAVRAV